MQLYLSETACSGKHLADIVGFSHNDGYVEDH